ncbi:MAG TPA: Na+/H+ antiporter NhaA [Burkholderiales bacterium]|nr:Na+/H+ antiporter NhaA [Burkholderiales bacterium]HXW06856.1 Na+/H+ antiporter NhaA [Vicinamibacterales bacterium]
MNEAPAKLPRALVEHLTRPFSRFVQIETAAGAVLLAATLVALLLSNSPWADAFLAIWETPVGVHIGSGEAVRSLKDWINDGAMTLFFFLVALELKREIVLGELGQPRVAALSIAAAAGGMLVPAGIYRMLQSGQPGAAGWGTVMATDTAFVIGCLALLGSRIPSSLRIFMLSMAITDDIGAILVVAVGYSSHVAWPPLALGIGACFLVRGMAALGIRSVPVYSIVGAMVWGAIDASGIHATVTGVVLGLLTPARRWVSDDRLYALLDQVIAHPSGHVGSGVTPDRRTLQVAEIAAREALSPVERLELALHPWVGFAIMPLFALANAGMPISVREFASPVAVAVFAGFVIGKPLGVVAFSWVAVRSGIAMRPPDLAWRLVAGGGLLAGIGFTMALFIANLAFSPDVIGEAKLGIFAASVVAAAAGLLILRTSARTVHG